MVFKVRLRTIFKAILRAITIYFLMATFTLQLVNNICDLAK